MGKALAQKAGIAAVESTLRSVMPELIRSLESMQSEIREFRSSVEAKFERVEERLAQLERGPDQIRLEFREQFADFYERLLTAINEVSHRVTRADQKLEDYSEFTRLTTSKMHEFLERVVRVEAAHQSPAKKRRAG